VVIHAGAPPRLRDYAQESITSRAGRSDTGIMEDFMHGVEMSPKVLEVYHLVKRAQRAAVPWNRVWQK
jgi:hypothetical protein